ncbi:uncharacterized protein DS421_2g43620 [Arachis hypogaea]|nr:uncharacterized protein DS421_2g43620 [Arachis hypogaea]
MAETSCTVKDNFFRAVVCQEKKSMGYFVPNHKHAEAERKAAHSNTLAQGSLPPPSPGSRRFHFLLFPLSGTQVAQLVVPIFPGFSVRGLEQLAVGSPLAVASPIAVVSPVAIRVFVEEGSVLASTFKWELGAGEDNNIFWS